MKQSLKRKLQAQRENRSNTKIMVSYLIYVKWNYEIGAQIQINYMQFQPFITLRTGLLTTSVIWLQNINKYIGQEK